MIPASQPKRAFAIPDSWRWATFPVAVFAFTRAGILAVAGWSLAMDPRLHRPSDPLRWPAVESLCRWDCGWFTRIAMDGYQDPAWSNFFPLFPMLGRAVNALTGIPIPIALLVCANLAALAGLLMVYKIFLELEGEAVARTSLSLLAAWPFFFFQATGYPESIMLLSTALAIWLAMRQRHLWAGTVLGLGILARHLTVIGGLALLVAQLRERGWHPRRFVLHRHFLGLVLPLAIASLYLVYLSVHFGDPLSWWKARSQGWGEAAWYGVWTYLGHMNEFEPQIGVYVALSVIPGVGAFLLLEKKSGWTLAGLGAGLMLALWSIGLMGLGRYTGSCWPAFLGLGTWLQRRPALQAPAICMLAMLQGMFVYLFTHSYPIN